MNTPAPPVTEEERGIVERLRRHLGLAFPGTADLCAIRDDAIQLLYLFDRLSHTQAAPRASVELTDDEAEAIVALQDLTRLADPSIATALKVALRLINRLRTVTRAQAETAGGPLHVRMSKPTTDVRAALESEQQRIEGLRFSKEWLRNKIASDPDLPCEVGPPAGEALMTDEQIKYMVDRFLCWKLPGNFNPDGGISFEPRMNEGYEFERKREPVGTNLFDAEQAKAMVRHMIEGLPAISPARAAMPGRHALASWLEIKYSVPQGEGMDWATDESARAMFLDDADAIIAMFKEALSSGTAVREQK